MLKRILQALPFICFLFFCLEISLRAFKSIYYDGTLHITSPSLNNISHQKYGWAGPPERSYNKSDACYGSGVVTYNEWGFRAPPIAMLQKAYPLICILGDSTIQGYQMPDGLHLPYLLSQALRDQYPDVYVLPLAVGGYGSIQELMLYRDYCLQHQPALTIVAFTDNDPVNNSFKAERFSGTGNIRPRPFLENGQIVMRRPYPLRLVDFIDNFMLFRTANLVLMKYLPRASQEEMARYVNEGWGGVQYFAQQLQMTIEPKLVLLSEDQTRAHQIFSQNGFETVLIPNKAILPGMQCLPKDSHLNGNGHAMLNSFVEPIVRRILTEQLRPRNANQSVRE